MATSMSETKALVVPAQSREYGDYYDAASEYSSGANTPRQPLRDFGSPSTLVGDNASPRSRRATMKGLWKGSIAVHPSRNQSVVDVEDEVKEGLLANSPRRRKSKRRPWQMCCMFGALGCLSLSALLLFINLALGIPNMIWPSTVDKTLQYWGKLGTGTEGLSWYPTDFLRDVNPIPCHSHNDYWRHVPLFSALRAGCTGVEADVWLFDDDLYVGHNTASLTRNRTFNALYIDSLVKILEHQNPTTEFYNGTRHGVFDTDTEKSLILLVDVKTGGTDTWQKVLDQLQPLRERDWLTYMQDGEVYPGPVTVVGTGNTPFDLLTQNQTYRDAFFDAPLDTMWEAPMTRPTMGHWAKPENMAGEEEGMASASAKVNVNVNLDVNVKKKLFAHNPAVDTDANAGQGLSGVLSTDEFNEQNSYYASVAFGKAVGSMWRGQLTPRQMRIIRGQIRGAHRRGLKVRYWDLPSWPLGLRNHVWDVLVKEGVDMLNVDDLRGVSKQIW